MEIIKFKKEKNNIYKIYFNNDTNILLYDDVIVKYNLLVNKHIDTKKINEIINYNDFLNGYYKAIKYINTKMRSELEIKKYLKKLDIKNIDRIIDLLKKDGYLNKDIYVKAFINDKYNLTNDGPIKIKNELNSLGYDENFYLKYLNTLNWYSKLDKLVDKKTKNNQKLSNNNLKSKVLNDLIKLGYEKTDILNKLESITFDNDDIILKKELLKIKNKYSKKYSDEQLYYKVINYLYNKGFLIDDIKRCYYENDV